MMVDTLANVRVLVIEDEYFIASDLARALAREGASVVGPAGDPERGLALAEAEPLDAAVLDVNLDGQNSLAIADRLSARGIPYVFLTGYDEWAMPAAHRLAPRIAKPFAMPTVLAAVRQLLTRVPA